jgi:mRNA interferase RelE/StbE
MQIKYEKSFLHDLQNITDVKIKKRIESVITEIKKSITITTIKNIKKLVGYKYYYRIRIGNYRMGIKIDDDNVVTLIRIKHRKDIYKSFP